MATQLIEPARVSPLGKTTIVYIPEAASQSFKKGQFIYLVAGAATVLASDATTIYGMALEDASGTTSNYIAVAVANADAMFEMNVTGAVTAIASVGTTKYALTVASNICSIDISDSSNDAFIIDSIITGVGKAVGDTYGRVVAHVIPAAQQSGIGA